MLARAVKKEGCKAAAAAIVTYIYVARALGGDGEVLTLDHGARCCASASAVRIFVRENIAHYISVGDNHRDGESDAEELHW